jgi:hypothetical protein
VIEGTKHHTVLVVASLLFVVTVAASLVFPGWKRRSQRTYGSYASSLFTLTAQAAEINAWTQAMAKVKQDRGEPIGKQAEVAIPAQLRHYSDTRRFLAIQVAEWRKYGFETPQDFVDLAAMIRDGQLVALQPVSENYILFGVGGNADKEPFTRYENGQSLNLYSETGLRQQYAHLAESISKIGKEIAGLRQQLSGVNKRDRSLRSLGIKLRTQIVDKEKAITLERKNKEQLDRFYGDADKRQELLRDYQSLAELGKSFPARTFDIADASARRDMKVRMLSSLRPEALKVLEEIAASYRQKFDRPLPITSLVRPDEYQHQLSKVNPNATRIETPPHSTGLAFDIYYHFMTAEEQSHVMAHLAQLKDEGRIEVLRENRDHYHVFAFIDGVRPDEGLIRASLGTTTAAKAVRETHHSEMVSTKGKKKNVRGKQPVSHHQRSKGKRR